MRRLNGRPDIRSGLDFEAIENGDYSSAGKTLRNLWETLRNVLPKYGFGRAELLPVRKTAEAVAAYIAKYIEKNLFNRRPEDKRKKLVRYIGWEKTQLKASEFSWGTQRATAWRMKARTLAGLVGIEQKEEMSEVTESTANGSDTNAGTQPISKPDNAGGKAPVSGGSMTDKIAAMERRKRSQTPRKTNAAPKPKPTQETQPGTQQTTQAQPRKSAWSFLDDL